MLVLIPITPVTLDFIEELNGGVRPKLETEAATYFIYRGKDEHAEILNESNAKSMTEKYEWGTTILMVVQD